MIQTRKLARGLGVILGIGVTVLLLLRLGKDWEAFQAQQVSLRFLPLSGSFLCFGAGFCSLVQGWRSLVGAWGSPVGYRPAFSIVVRASLGRYIPGKVWAAAGLVYLGRGFGIPAGTGAAAAVFSTLLLLLTGGLISVFRLGLLVSFPLQLLLGLGIFVLILVLLHPALQKLLSRLVVRWGGSPVPECRYRDLLACLPFYLLFWVLMGAGFVLSVFSLTGSITSPGVLGSAYALAYTGGIAAVFVPGGLGVREGLLAWALTGVLPAPRPAAVGIFSRLWATAGEAFLFCLTFLPGIRASSGIDEDSNPVRELP